MAMSLEKKKRLKTSKGRPLCVVSDLWSSVLQAEKGGQSFPFPEGPYTLTMELGPKTAIPSLVLGT